MRIAIDATYSLGHALSGVGVYSRELMLGLAAARPDVRWEWFYRSQKYFRAGREARPENVKRRFLHDTWGSRAADLFHGLNQRLPQRRFRKQIATFHDLFVLSGEYSTNEFRERFAAQACEAAAAADRIIAVSAFTARQVEEFLGVEPARIRVVHHGIVPRKIPAVNREKVVLCVGAIQRRKNQARLVRAFRAMPVDWKLVLAGSEGFESGETTEAIQKSGCADRILVTGYIAETELAEWYGRASIFAFPSLDEGFGMPVLEAMAAGIPVVSSNRSAMPEVCGEAALLVEPESEDAIGTALLDLARNDERRDSLAALGISHAARFTWAAAVAKTLAVYRDLFPF